MVEDQGKLLVQMRHSTTSKMNMTVYRLPSGHNDIYSKGGERRTIFGKERNLIIWFYLIIGDIQGNNNLAAAYQNSGVRPYRLCKCTYDDLDAELLACEYVTLAEFKQ
jgi:hypothetical protein